MTTIDHHLLCDSYHGILKLGLENLQRAELPELQNYLRLEIDHLHNIPSYMKSNNLYRHAYYFCTERPYYIERVTDFPMINAESILKRYAQYWDLLHAELLAFAEVINAGEYTEKL